MAEFLLALLVNVAAAVLLAVVELGALDALARAPGFWSLEMAADAYGLITLSVPLTLWAGLSGKLFGRALARGLFELLGERRKDEVI